MRSSGGEWKLIFFVLDSERHPRILPLLLFSTRFQMRVRVILLLSAKLILHFYQCLFKLLSKSMIWEVVLYLSCKHGNKLMVTSSSTSLSLL